MSNGPEPVFLTADGETEEQFVVEERDDDKYQYRHQFQCDIIPPEVVNHLTKTVIFHDEQDGEKHEGRHQPHAKKHEKILLFAAFYILITFSVQIYKKISDDGN